MQIQCIIGIYCNSNDKKMKCELLIFSHLPIKCSRRRRRGEKYIYICKIKNLEKEEKKHPYENEFVCNGKNGKNGQKILNRKIRSI